jgi:hypothetical protein
MLDMRRREFITLIGGAGLAWPLGARAQQDGSIPRIGILWPGASLPAPPRMEAFRQGLRDLGFIDGCGRRCRAGIQRGPDALQASDAQQQIQPKDEDKKE